LNVILSVDICLLRHKSLPAKFHPKYSNFFNLKSVEGCNSDFSSKGATACSHGCKPVGICHPWN